MHPVWDRVQALLRENGVTATEIAHAEGATADAIAAHRGTPLEIGGKAIVLKPGAGGFVVCALSAATEMDSRLVRKALGARRLRFATPEELLDFTGLVTGTVPPFGEPVLPFPLYVDSLLVSLDEIAFTAGRRDRSLRMPMADYLRLAKPRVISFARPRN